MRMPTKETFDKSYQGDSEARKIVDAYYAYKASKRKPKKAKPIDKYWNTFESNIAGIPCLIAITSASEYVPSNWPFCHPDDAYEAYGGDVEWQVYDRKGYEAKWLVSKLTDADNDRINKEAEQHV